MIYLAVKRMSPKGFVGQTVENTASLESLHIFINEEAAMGWIKEHNYMRAYMMMFDDDGIVGQKPVRHHGSLIHK